MPQTFSPTTFQRHNRPLRTLLLESQAWFCARDMGRLMGWPLNDRTTRKLDADQKQVVRLMDACGEADELMVSESGVYVMLVHHYHAENRELRQWITNEVVPCLRDEREMPQAGNPSLSFLQWPGLSVSLLHWRSEPWIRLRDMPRVSDVQDDQACPSPKVTRPWWQAVRGLVRLS